MDIAITPHIHAPCDASRRMRSAVSNCTFSRALARLPGKHMVHQLMVDALACYCLLVEHPCRSARLTCQTCQTSKLQRLFSTALQQHQNRPLPLNHRRKTRMPANKLQTPSLPAFTSTAFFPLSPLLLPSFLATFDFQITTIKPSRKGQLYGLIDNSILCVLRFANNFLTFFTFFFFTIHSALR